MGNVAKPMRVIATIKERDGHYVVNSNSLTESEIIKMMRDVADALEINKERICDTCKYYKTPPSEGPCWDCDENGSEWVKNKSTAEIKNGDD